MPSSAHLALLRAVLLLYLSPTHPIPLGPTPVFVLSDDERERLRIVWHLGTSTMNALETFIAGDDAAPVAHLELTAILWAAMVPDWTPWGKGHPSSPKARELLHAALDVRRNARLKQAEGDRGTSSALLRHASFLRGRAAVDELLHRWGKRGPRRKASTTRRM